MSRTLNNPRSLELVGLLLLAVSLASVCAVSPDLRSPDHGHAAFGQSVDVGVVTGSREVAPRTLSVVQVSHVADSFPEISLRRTTASNALARLVIATIVRPLRI